MRPCIKPTFLTYQKPLLVAMVQEETPDDMILEIVNALYDGAEAFGIQLENLKREYRDLETLKRIFAACENRPIYVTSYRSANSTGMTDEECADFLLMAADAGATLFDIMGDFYHQSPHDITYDPEAVEKQKELAKKIKEKGGEVLFSSHIHSYFDEEQCLEVARAQVERGADVVKIVNFSGSEEEMMANLNTIHRLKKELPVPFLLLANGPYCRFIRQMGPELGVCMYLCMQHTGPRNSREQPQLRAMKIVRDNMV